VILEFTDPYAELRQTTSSLIQIRRNNNGLDLMPPVLVDETDYAKFMREADNADRKDEVKALYNIHLKSNSECEKDLTQNLTIMWATIMRQCTPALQEEVHGEPDYIMSKCAAFNGVWLLQSLQKITAGVNKTTNKYYSAFKATKKFYGTQPFDGVWLLQSLQKITAGVNKTTNKYYSAFKATKKFYGTQQSPTEGIDEYHNRLIYSPIGKPAQHQLPLPTIVGELQAHLQPLLLLEVNPEIHGLNSYLYQLTMIFRH
jgi:hypothetical protein